MKTISIWAALFFVLLAPPVSASPSARRRFERGQQLYASGQYREAGAEFLRAFELNPRPKYLYNAAQALRLGGDCPGSVAAYEAFLRIAPDADSRAAASRNLERCTAPPPAPESSTLAATPEVPPPPDPDPPPTGPAPPPPVPAAELAPAAATSSTTIVAPRRPRRLAWVGAVGGAATGAALLTASILEGLAASQFDQLTRTCAPRCQAAEVMPLQRQLDAATGLFVVSGVLAAATIVALAVTHARPPLMK